MGYKCVYMLSEIQEYLKNTVLFAFDFETSPAINGGTIKVQLWMLIKQILQGSVFQYQKGLLYMFHLNIVAGEMQRTRRQYGII